MKNLPPDSAVYARPRTCQYHIRFESNSLCIFLSRVANSALPSAGPPATQNDADDDDEDVEVTLSVGGVGVSGSNIQKANPMTGSEKIAIYSSCQAGLRHLLSSNFASYKHHPSIEKSYSCSSALRSY